MAFADDSLSDFALDLDIEVQVIEALEEASEEEEPLLSVMMAVGLLIILTTVCEMSTIYLCQESWIKYIYPTANYCYLCMASRFYRRSH